MKARAIGVVHNGVTEGRDEGLDGIDGFSHALVVYRMHESSFDAARDLERRPRGRLMRGYFSS
ncbi:MAG TPA: hypothetical protein VGH63_15110 [Polyangia bacterium]